MIKRETPSQMTCLFCPDKSLSHYHESYDYMGFLGGREYQCGKCGTKYSRAVRSEPYPNNHIEWEELSYYELRQSPFTAKFYFYPQPSCCIFKDEGSLTWSVLKFKYHPPHLTPFNLVEKASIWVTFS